MTYEIAIDLHTSPLQAVPGQTIGFGIWVNDPDNFYPGPYGFAGEWPWGLLRETAATLGDLVLALPGDIVEESLEAASPTMFALYQNYPNPFNAYTRINHIIPEKTNIELKVINVSGQCVKILDYSEKSAGKHSIEFNAESLPSGIYFLTLKTSEYYIATKMTLLK